MKRRYPRKLQQLKLGNNLIKVKHDEYEDTYILEHRIKNPVTTNAKYIHTKVTSKDLFRIKRLFNEIVEKVEIEKGADELGAKLKQSKWDKYAVSTFYK